MKKTLLLMAFSLSCAILSAQPPPPDPQGSADPDDAVPITGLEWLLAGGCALGLKKIIDTRKNAKKEGSEE